MLIIIDYQITFKFQEVIGPIIEKLERNTLRIETHLGSFYYNTIEYVIDRFYMKSPSEHRVGGLTYGFEVQVEGRTNTGGRATLVAFGEENSDLYNKELIDIGIGRGVFKGLKVSETKVFKKHKLNLNKILKNDQKFVVYSGQSTNENCPYSLMIVALNTFWISHKQMVELGELTAPAFKAKPRPFESKFFQNFIKPEPDSAFRQTFSHLTLNSNYNFPVPLPYKNIMYNPGAKTP